MLKAFIVYWGQEEKKHISRQQMSAMNKRREIDKAPWEGRGGKMPSM